MGKTISNIFKTVSDPASIFTTKDETKPDTTAQEELARAQQEELDLAEADKLKAQEKVFAEAEQIKKGFRSRGQGLSVLGESENQLLG